MDPGDHRVAGTNSEESDLRVSQDSCHDNNDMRNNRLHCNPAKARRKKKPQSIPEPGGTSSWDTKNVRFLDIITQIDEDGSTNQRRVPLVDKCTWRNCPDGVLRSTRIDEEGVNMTRYMKLLVCDPPHFASIDVPVVFPLSTLGYKKTEEAMQPFNVAAARMKALVLQCQVEAASQLDLGGYITLHQDVQAFPEDSDAHFSKTLLSFLTKRPADAHFRFHLRRVMSHYGLGGLRRHLSTKVGRTTKVI